MECGICRSVNDEDALFCEHCGHALAKDSPVRPAGRSRLLLYGLVASAVVLLLILGYYRFILPRGVAAVVNGDVITLAEIDAVLAGAKLPPDMRDRVRYKVLSDLIAERIAWQEARKAGVGATATEIEEAYGRFIASTGSDLAAAEEQVRLAYGGKKAFRNVLERRLAIRKYIDGHIATGSRTDVEAGARVEQWMKGSVARAEVRIALSEQVPGGKKPGCSCCTGSASGGPGAAQQRADPKVQEARQAALAYWHERTGEGDVEARAKDFGCHVQVDIIKNNRIAASLRYQNGTITGL